MPKRLVPRGETVPAPVVGMPLYGFCGGYFGRDSYTDRRIEAVGYGWIVTRNEDGTPEFLNLSSADIWREVYRASVAELVRKAAEEP